MQAGQVGQLVGQVLVEVPRVAEERAGQRGWWSRSSRRRTGSPGARRWRGRPRRAGPARPRARACTATLMPSAGSSRSMSKYSRPAWRSSSIRRRTVDSCQWVAAARAALAGPAVAGQLGQQRVVLGPGVRGACPVAGGAGRPRRSAAPGLAARGVSGGCLRGPARPAARRQGAGVARPGARGENVQDRVRGDCSDLAAAGQAAQEQGVALLRACAPASDADDLGAARGQPNPAGIRPAGQGVGDRSALPGVVCRRTNQSTQPAGIRR